MASPFSGPVAAVCEALVATPSESGEEELIAGLAEERCIELGVVLERPGHPVAARTGGDGAAMAPGRHLDTGPNWPRGTGRGGGDRIGGRGAADMKGGVAVMLRLLERTANQPRPTVYIFYDREE